MEKLNRTRYHTMNSWNNSTAPAYNLKVHHCINRNLQSKVFELMECENFYDEINDRMRMFDAQFDYKWQTGFNGRSGGYLVLYRGEIKDNHSFSYPGKTIKDNEVPAEVLRAFRNLAVWIVRHTENLAKHAQIKEESYCIQKTRKVIKQ
jgi:hypothetical protein